MELKKRSPSEARENELKTNKRKINKWNLENEARAKREKCKNENEQRTNKEKIFFTQSGGEK